MTFDEFGAFAASRGDGMHPKLRELFERAATFPFSEVTVRPDGLLQAGPNPHSEEIGPTDAPSRDRRWRSGRPAILGVIALLFVECLGMQSVKAELGPCISAAPTTKEVLLYVSDMKRSVNWYHDNVGLNEVSSFRSIERDPRAVVMERDGNGVTLISSGKERHAGPDPQMVCFPQKGFHDPTRPRIFLEDPDGTSVELAVSPHD
jgi:Glyoxalase/Bleomycin resistance protein/Dioxygenase superfamily